MIWCNSSYIYPQKNQSETGTKELIIDYSNACSYLPLKNYLEFDHILLKYRYLSIKFEEALKYHDKAMQI